MTIPLTRAMIVGVVEEVTEGTYVAPTANDVIQLADIPTVSPELERIARNLISNSIGRMKSLNGAEGGSIEMTVELRGAGDTAGVPDAPEIDLLLKSALGSRTTSADTETTDVGSTDTLIELTGGGASFSRGDPVLIDGEMRFVSSVSSDQLTLNRALDKGAPSSGVTVVRGYGYKPVISGHTPLSITAYFHDGTNSWTQRMKGCRCSQVAFADFTAGQIPKITFTFQCLSHEVVIGSPLASPVYEDQDPPIAKAGLVYKDTTEFHVNNIGLSIAQQVTPEKSINSASGINRLFITSREISGSFDPYIDPASKQIYDDWKNNTDMEIQAGLSIPDSSGDFQVGTSVGFWLPQVNYTGLAYADQDGSMKHELPYEAHDTADGSDDIYLAVI